MVRTDDAALALQFARIAKIDEGDIVVAEKICGRLRRHRFDLGVGFVEQRPETLLHLSLHASPADAVPATMSRLARFVKVHSNQRSDP